MVGQQGRGGQVRQAEARGIAQAQENVQPCRYRDKRQAQRKMELIASTKATTVTASVWPRVASQRIATSVSSLRLGRPAGRFPLDHARTPFARRCSASRRVLQTLRCLAAWPVLSARRLKDPPARDGVDSCRAFPCAHRPTSPARTGRSGVTWMGRWAGEAVPASADSRPRGWPGALRGQRVPRAHGRNGTPSP